MSPGSGQSERQNVEHSNRRPETLVLSSISQPVHRQPGVIDRVNDYLVSITAGVCQFTRDQNVDIHVDSTDNDDYSSNSAKSSYKARNSYININANVRSSYQSLVGDTAEEYDTNSYGELNEDQTTNTHYINLRI